MSGATAMRFLEAMAYALMLPALTCGIDIAGVSSSMSMLPAIRSCIDWPALRYGTSVKRVLMAAWNMMPPTWLGVAMPELAWVAFSLLALSQMIRFLRLFA